MLPLSLSSSHTRTEQQRKTPTGLDLFLGMKNQSVFIFFFINNSVSQFGSQRRQLGWCPNSRQSQFLGIFFVFSTLIMSLTNSLFSIQCIYLYRYCFFIPVKPKKPLHKTYTTHIQLHTQRIFIGEALSQITITGVTLANHANNLISNLSKNDGSQGRRTSNQSCS